MCGILALFNFNSLDDAKLRKIALANARLLRHRGPDWSGLYLWSEGNEQVGELLKNVALAHERLSIVDPESGEQPLHNDDKSLLLAVNGEIYNHESVRNDFSGAPKSKPDCEVIAVNGEIYNHEKVRKDFNETYNFKTKSDCEVIIPLYEKYGKACVNHLDGMFAFVLFDRKKKTFYAARDHIGIVPLYIGWSEDGGIAIGSELKAIQSICKRFELFPPGHYYDFETHTFVRWWEPVWLDINKIPSEPLEYHTLFAKFEKAVVKRMMTDVPWGVLLSGGLDSSLVACVASKYAKKTVQAYPAMHTFSIGLKGSPDLAAAEKVAKFLGTKHHSFTYKVQEGIDAISDVIYHLETYDITTIRASTPMYLLARRIKSMGVKMVLSGEGADEAFGGYLYFHKAPNKEELHKETVNKLMDLHYFDCLRANKAMSAHGVEPRVPFLDRELLDYVMTLDPEWKMCKVRKGDEHRGSIEKFIMRKAFEMSKLSMPEEVLWRQKEQFSDGVGYSWIDSLREKAEKEITPLQWQNRSKRFPKNTPATKEGYVYRAIFEGHFPSESAIESVKGGPSIACSTSAAIEWDESFKKLAASVGGDNSGRAVAGVHDSAYEDVEAVVSGKATDGNGVANGNGLPPAKKQKV